MAVKSKKPMTSTQKIKSNVVSKVQKPSITSKVKQMASNPTVQKIGIGLGSAVLGAGVGYATAKFLGKRKRPRGVAKLKSQVVKKQLKIRNLQLDRKLLKEQLKGI